MSAALLQGSVFAYVIGQKVAIFIKKNSHKYKEMSVSFINVTFSPKWCFIQTIQLFFKQNAEAKQAINTAKIRKSKIWESWDDI